MKRPASITTIIFPLLLLGAIAACTPDKPSDTPQISPSPANGDRSDQSQSSNPKTKERDRRRESRRKQIEAILTPEQLQQLQTKLKQGEKFQSALSSLDLTTDQKNKLKMISDASQKKKPNSSPEKSQ
jgi:Spy/CpxP family protein refolding chaperone